MYRCIYVHIYLRYKIFPYQRIKESTRTTHRNERWAGNRHDVSEVVYWPNTGPERISTSLFWSAGSYFVFQGAVEKDKLAIWRCIADLLNRACLVVWGMVEINRFKDLRFIYYYRTTRVWEKREEDRGFLMHHSIQVEYGNDINRYIAP